MKFYRLATEKDFEMAIRNCEEIPQEVRALIEAGLMPKAIQRLRLLKGIGIIPSKDTCEYYASVLQAKSDHEEGKAVYTEY